MKLVKLGLSSSAISVQYKSISILARIGSYEEIRTGALRLSFEGRRRLFYKLVQWKRTEIVEALIEEIYTKIVLSNFVRKLRIAALRERINVWYNFYEVMEGLCTHFPDEILEYVIQ